MHMNRRPLFARISAASFAVALLAVITAAAAMAQTPSSPASPNRKIYMYQGADRDQRLIEQAKKEGQVMFYSTMTVADGRMLAAAFEKKYGIRVTHWRSGAERIVNRAIAEARAKRNEVDVIETSANRMEMLHRERMLEDFHSPVLREIVPAAFPRSHRQYVADRFAFFVMGYNTNLVKPEELPATYDDLLHPRWTGRVTIEGTDMQWFGAVARSMGGEKGLAFFRKLAALKPEIRSSHILIAQLIAAGEVSFCLNAFNNNLETLKLQGAPVDWKPLQPAFGQASSIGVARYATRPHAALLFVEFVLSKEGQEIVKAANRVPSNRLVDSPLNKFKHELIDSELSLDEDEKWKKQFASIFLGGKAIKGD
jgi:iron(III) transport system substrate-binding protein